MFISLLELVFDLTFVIIKKTSSGIYYSGKYLLLGNEKETDLKETQKELLLLTSINDLRTELESMKITIEELKKQN